MPPIDLDRIDRKILYMLDKNSRQHSSEIAKKLKLSRQVVDYRIKKLLSRGFIRSFTSFTDPSKFGLSSWKIYLQLRGTSEKVENEMLSYLGSSKNVWWTVKCFGSYDLLFSVLAKDFYDFNKILYNFNNLFGDYIHKEDINNHLEPIYFSRGWLVNQEPIKICDHFMKKPYKEKFDKIDVGIMKLLGKNCRLTSTQIASKTHTTPRIVNYRIKDLIKRKFIVFNRLSIDPQKFGLEFYKGLVYLKSTEEKVIKKLIEYCRMNKHINECVKSVGSWQFELEMEVSGLSHFGIIVEDLKRKFSDVVLRVEPLLLYKEVKPEFNFLDHYSDS